MARRVSNTNAPDSLKEAKLKEEQAVARTSSAEKKLSEITNAISAAERQGEEIKASVAALEATKEQKQSELSEINTKVSEAKDELRQVEGELATAITGVEAAKREIGLLKEEHENTLKKLQEEHLNQMAAYKKTQSEAQGAINEIADTIKRKKLELEGTEKVIARFQKEEQRLEKEILPQIPAAEEKLGTLNHQLLVKQKEIKDAEEAYKEMVGKHNNEKVLFESVQALRAKEEDRVEAELKKLIDKEREVESKAASLRHIKEGVDAAVARLERKERDMELKGYLAKPKEVIPR